MDYQTLGVRKVINASGTLTRLGGSLMPPEVVAAMSSAAGSFVDLHELVAKSGEYLAKLLGVGGALVVNGAYAGMVAALSACMAGRDTFRIRHLPITEGLKNEVIVLKSHRNLYDHAIRQTGAIIREVGLSDFSFDWDLRNAFTSNTCAVVYYASFEEQPGSLPLDEVIAMAREFRVPVIVDAAAELPPVENLWMYYRRGADLVIFSGGKDLRGPQSAGLLVGSKELIELCRLNAFPNYGMNRASKAAKEEIMGMVAAVDLYLKEDLAARYGAWEHQMDVVLQSLKAIPGINARRVFPGVDYIRPAVIPRVYFEAPEGSGWTAETLERTLQQGEPPIVLAREGRTLIVNPHMLQPGEESLVADRIAGLLKAAGPDAVR